MRFWGFQKIWRRWFLGIALIGVVLFVSDHLMLKVYGQNRPKGNVLNPGKSSGVQLNITQELELKALVDYVSGRLKIRILYDNEIANKKVTIRAPGKIPVESLLGVLQSALKMKGFALVDAEVPGWKRVVSSNQLQATAQTGEAKNVGTATAVTQAFTLKHTTSKKADAVVKPFLSKPGANSIALDNPNILIVTDFAKNLLKIEKLIKLVDQPKANVEVKFVKAQHVEAASLSTQVKSILQAEEKSRRDKVSNTVEIAHDERTNQLILVGSPEKVDWAIEMIKKFDVALGLTTEVYSLKYVTPERVDELMKKLLTPLDVKRVYRSAVDQESNLLIVTTTPKIQARLKDLCRRFDVAVTMQQSPVRFYRLQNVAARDVLQTLQVMEQARGSDAPTGRQPGTRSDTTNYTRMEGAFRMPLQPGEPLPRLRVDEDPNNTNNNPAASQRGGTMGASGSQARAGNVFFGGASITADENTNSIIVVAEPSIQQYYKNLIQKLDQRISQVLVEVKIVAIDTSDEYELGVEISGGDGIGAKKLFAFTSYGLSKVDPITGALALIPGKGFNGTLVDPDVADVVVRALANHSRAKVLSSPRILVNDNSSGTLSSTLSMPYESLNASQTVSTTSLGGTQDAGTTITCTPHIGKGDYMQLEFSIEFSAFMGTGSANLPPPRQIQSIKSSVTIPDGHAVIVGGLNHREKSNSAKGFPFIENIPIVKYAAGLHGSKKKNTSFFVFIRPMILRDDKFKDLKFLSERDACRADISGQYPVSRAQLLR